MHGQTLLSPGDTVAGYEIEKAVARGGFAVVYRARDVSLGRRVVALKVIAPELAGNEKFRQRFIRESELAASIDHPNILPVFRAGEDHGVLYIAMRFVEGQDLGKFFSSRGVPPVEEALPIFTQVAAALDVAHGHGLVHRDVKPGNILVSDTVGHDDGPHVYLADFGLTKRSSSLSGITTARHFIGTPAYSAPEQISGDAVDARTDIYSLGCVVYEALTGRPPFQREEDMALLWAHVYTAPTPPSEIRRGLPTAVDAVLARALAKKPEERHDSCRAMVTDLRVAFRQAPSDPLRLRPLPPGSPRPRPDRPTADTPLARPEPRPEARPEPPRPEPPRPEPPRPEPARVSPPAFPWAASVRPAPSPAPSPGASPTAAPTDRPTAAAPASSRPAVPGDETTPARATPVRRPVDPGDETTPAPHRTMAAGRRLPPREAPDRSFTPPRGLTPPEVVQPRFGAARGMPRPAPGPAPFPQPAPRQVAGGYRHPQTPRHPANPNSGPLRLGELQVPARRSGRPAWLLPVGLALVVLIALIVFWVHMLTRDTGGPAAAPRPGAVASAPDVPGRAETVP